MTSPDIMSSLSDLDLAVPTRLTKQLNEAVDGDFEVVRLIARGAMGIVFLGRDLKLEREVAIKVLLADAFTTKSEVERFKLEARTVARLVHPNIVPVYSVLEYEELLLYIMQYVEGETLEEMISHGPIDPEVVEAIVVMVAGGLAYAHEQDIVHRDVKPANVIVDSRGRAIIMDFGIAQLPENHGLTVAGSLVGTPNYASPEQCRAQAASPASDQYSLGVVAYEMLTGQRLFESDSMAGIIQHHLETPPPAIRDMRPDCPAPLAHAIERMLEKAPEARWPDLSELVDYLGGPRHTAPMAALTASEVQKSTGNASWTRGADSLPPTQSPDTKAKAKAPLSALVMIATAAILIALTSTGFLTSLGFGPETPPASPIETAEGSPPGDPNPGGVATVPDSTERTLAAGDPTGGEATEGDPSEVVLAGADPEVTAVEDDPPVEAGPETTPPVTTPPVTTPDDSPPAEPAPLVVDETPATLLLGTRGLAAVLYLDDVPMGAASRLRSWTIEPGTHDLSLRVEGCPTWDTTIVAPAGGDVRLGYRLPDCGREENFR